MLQLIRMCNCSPSLKDMQLPRFRTIASVAHVRRCSAVGVYAAQSYGSLHWIVVPGAANCCRLIAVGWLLYRSAAAG